MFKFSLGIFLCFNLFCFTAFAKERTHFETLYQGALSPRKQAGVQKIDSLAAFSQLWIKLGNPSQNRPNIDFRKEYLIAIFAGQKPTAGYSIRVGSLDFNKGALLIRAVLQSPKPDQFVSQIETSPYHLIRVSKQFHATQLKLEWRASDKSTGRPLKIQTVSRLSNSLITKKQYVVARDDVSLRQIWRRHLGSLDGLPAIDFQRLMVMAVFMGKQKTGGYDIEITRIISTPRNLEVWVKETYPKKDSMLIQILTAPAHIVILPKSSKPVVIRFEGVNLH